MMPQPNPTETITYGGLSGAEWDGVQKEYLDFNGTGKLQTWFTGKRSDGSCEIGCRGPSRIGYTSALTNIISAQVGVSPV